MKNEIDFIYDVKCRNCNAVCRMYFGSNKTTSKESFRAWLSEHSTYPIDMQCKCDNGMVQLHDIVSFGPSMSIL